MTGYLIFLFNYHPQEDLTQTLGQVRTQLEAEVRSGQEASQRVTHLETRVEELTTQLREVAKGCVSDDVKATIAKVCRWTI